MEMWMRKRKNKWLAERPFSEWRLPAMVISVSGMVFILLTSMFGITIDTRSGTVNWDMEPGSDWNAPIPALNPVVGKSSEDEYHVNPMTQYPWFCFLAMILGYFICVGFFIIGWFHYLQWRWVHVPEEIRFVEKKKRRKINVRRRNEEID
jgi:hypothetical protein